MQRSIRAALVAVTVVAGVVLAAPAAFASHQVTSIAPNGFPPGAPGGDTVTITGTGFSATPPPTVTTNAPNVTFSNVVVVNPTTITTTISSVPANASDGLFNVTVTQVPSLDVASCTNCLRIGPVVDSFTPGGGWNNVGNRAITATGRGLHTDAVLEIKRNNYGFNQTESTLLGANSGSRTFVDNGDGTQTVGGTFNLNLVAPGTWQLRVTNASTSNTGTFGDGISSGIAITALDPTVAGTNPVTPAQFGVGAGTQVLTVAGGNFATGMTLCFETPTNGDNTCDEADRTKIAQSKKATLDAVTPATKFAVEINVTANAPVGPYDVFVVNAAGGKARCAGCFTVTPAPTITAVNTGTTPNGTIGRGASAVAVTVVGTGFQNGATLAFTPPDGLTVSNVAFVDDQHLTLTLDVARTAPTSARSLQVTNADGGASTAFANAVTVATGPTISSLDNTSVAQGGTQTVVITGTELWHSGGAATDVSVTFSGTGLTASGYTDASDPLDPLNPRSKVRFTVTAAAGAAVSPPNRDLTLTNTKDRGADVKLSTFSIGPGPTITSVVREGSNPPEGALGQGASARRITVTGTNFHPDSPPGTPKVAVSFTPSAGLSGISVVRDSATQLTVTMSVDGAAAVGARDIKVTNTDDNGSFTSPGGFTVNQRPATTCGTGPTVGQGARGFAITVPGDHFSTGFPPTVTFNPADVTATSVTSNIDGTSLTVLVDVAQNAVIGKKDITVVNPDGGTSPACNLWLTVSQGPSVSNVSPGFGKNDAPLGVTISGANFQASATAKLQRTGFTDIPLSISGTPGASSMSGTFPLDTGGAGGLRAAPGTWTARVTNGDGGSATWSTGFTVSSDPQRITNAVIQGTFSSAAPPGATRTLAITGTNFADGTTIDMGPNITIGTPTITDVSHLTVPITIALDAPAGRVNVAAVRADGAIGDCGANECSTFTITGGPAITQLRPSVLNPGTTTTVTVVGSNFQFGAVVSLNTTGTSVRVGTTGFDTAQQLTVPVTVDSNVGPSLFTLRVTNPDGGVGQCVNCLVITDQGYWLVASDGGIFSFPPSRFHGSTGALRLNKPIVGMATTPSGQGYWLVASDGGIFTFGDAKFFGSTGALRLNKPIVGMAATPSGEGYWLVASDGGIFTFGDAKFFGSTGAITLNKPIVGMAATPDGQGYWMVASDGGIFTFGSAEYLGSMGAVPLNQPVVGMATTPDGRGYWMVAADGGIFSFGTARFFGSTGDLHLNKPIVGMTPSQSGNGYRFVASDGGIFSFGDALFLGSMGGSTLNAPIVGMARSA